MNFSTQKYIGLILILIMIIGFNSLFFTALKKRTDFIYNSYIIPHISEKAKEELIPIMAKKLYSRTDLDKLANLTFVSYKESLINRDLLSDKIKNLSLINIKMVTYDINNFYFGINYIFNLISITTFLFLFIFKEQKTGVRHEPTLYT